MPKFFVAAVMTVCAVLLAGCSSEDPSAKQAGTSTTGASKAQVEKTKTVDSITAAVKVSADKTHAVQPNDIITLTIAVEGFELDPSAVGRQNMPGRGHFRVYLNEAGGDDFLAEGASTTIQVVVPEDITDGSHELRVVLLNNDNTPLDPPVEGGVLLIVYRL